MAAALLETVRKHDVIDEDRQKTVRAWNCDVEALACAQCTDHNRVCVTKARVYWDQRTKRTISIARQHVNHV